MNTAPPRRSRGQQEIIMIALDKGTLPRRIGQNDTSGFAGENAYWYCNTCHQWRTSEIQPDGSITCPVCGGGPDWKKHQPTLAYGSRHKRVADLCAVGSGWRKSYDEVEQSYGSFIEEVSSGLPLRTQEEGWKYFQNAWRTVDELADYLLTAPDAPKTDSVSVYTERGLQRRYYDPRRKCNTNTLSSLSIPLLTDDGGAQFTDQEAAEIISLHAGYSQPFYDVYFADEFLECISDRLERSIAYDLSRGATKRDIERRYRLTEQQVRTRVAHIAKALKK